MSPLDTAVYWTEYVLRHGDCAHMKPLALYQPWWQRRLLDVWLFVMAVVLFIICLIVMAFSASARILISSRKSNKKKS